MRGGLNKGRRARAEGGLSKRAEETADRIRCVWSLGLLR